MHVVMTCIVGPIYIRTERVDYNSVYLPGRKLISMQNSKSIVAMVFQCYFFNQPLHCNVCRYGLHYNVMIISVLQDVEGLKKNYTSLYFPRGRPVSMHNFMSMFTRFTCFNIGMASIRMYCLD